MKNKLTTLNLGGGVKIAILYRQYQTFAHIVKIYHKSENVYNLIYSLGLLDYFAYKLFNKIKNQKNEQ